MGRTAALLGLLILAGACDRGGDATGAPSPAPVDPSATGSAGEPAARLQPLAPETKPPVDTAPAPDPADAADEDDREATTTRTRTRHRHRTRGNTTMSGGDTTMSGGDTTMGGDDTRGPDDVREHDLRERDTRERDLHADETCPGGGPCPNGGYLVETCVTGGMARRDENGVLRASHSCTTHCAPAPPLVAGSMSCQHAGCRRYHCEGYAP